MDGFKMACQDPYDNLCWAAVALSVERLRKLGSSLALCDVVEKTPPNPGCCGNLSSAQCNHVGLLLPALQTLGHAPMGVLPGYPPNAETMNIKWEEIKHEIDAKRVVCVGIDWTGGAKHYVAIWGYEESDDGRRIVYVQDPKQTSSTPFFSDFINGYQNGAGKCSELIKIL